MEFTLRDIIYMAVYVATIAGLFTKVQSKLNQLSKSNESIKNIIFLEKGGLNVVDNAKCVEHRNVVHNVIRREAETTQDAVTQIHCLNQNIIKIMVHMKLEPISVDPAKHKN